MQRHCALHGVEPKRLTSTVSVDPHCGHSAVADEAWRRDAVVVEPLAPALRDPVGRPRREQHPLDMHVLEPGFVERLADRHFDRHGRRAAGVGRADPNARRIVDEAADDAEVGDGQHRDLGIGNILEHGHDRRFIDLGCDRTHAPSLHLLQRERDSLADADAHGGERELAAGALQLLGRGQREAGARHAERVAERDRAAVGVHPRHRRRRCPSWRSTARPWAAKASFNSITSKSPILRPSRFISFSVAGAGPMPMIRGGTPATAAPSTRARGVRPLRLAASSEAMMIAAAPSLTPEALPAVTVPSARTIGFSFAERFEGGRARVLVLVDDDRIALALRNLDRDDLGGEPAVGLRRGGFLLAAQREGVLVLAADLELLGDILAGARHGVVAIGVASSSD